MNVLSPPAETRVILYGVSWSTYQALLADLGDHRGRLTYDRGTLEIMSPSEEHEGRKRLIGRFIEVFTEERNIDIKSMSSTTLQSELKERGHEPDESYYIQNEPVVRGKLVDLNRDPPPDLAIEIDVRRSGIDRMGLYAALGVPEVWVHDGKALGVHLLKEDGHYEVSETSAALPQLTMAELMRFLDLHGSLSETALVRSFRAWVRERFGTA